MMYGLQVSVAIAGGGGEGEHDSDRTCRPNGRGASSVVQKQKCLCPTQVGNNTYPPSYPEDFLCTRARF